MVKVMYNDKFVYKVVIWVFWGISLWKEKETLIYTSLDDGKRGLSEKTITYITDRQTDCINNII